MSDTNKNNYTANDLLDEFFPSGETAVPELETDISDPGTEEISADETVSDSGEIVTDTLEEDNSEAENADITVIGKSEWETSEITETISELFDGSIISEDVSADFRDNSAVSEDTKKSEENVESEKETEEETEISQNPKMETSEITEMKDRNETKELSAEDIDSEFNESFMKRFLKGIVPWKGDSVLEIIRKIIFIAATAVFIGAGCMLVSTLIQSKQAVEQKEKDRDIIVTTAATTIDESGNVVVVAPTEEQEAEHRFNVAEYYKGINEDYVGYLELSGCDIAEPIVQGEDNDYYLTHAIHGGTNKAGTVFMDYRCTFSEDYVSPNIVFYGHNQEDGTMFGNLKDYKQNVQFYEENPSVKFSTENETYEYLIYGFFVTNALEKQDSNGEVFHYQDYIETMSDETTFNWYLDMVNERNQIVSPVDVEFGDKLLCLSTCSNEFSNSRFVVFARMLREGETADDYDFSETYLNPYARGVDWDAIMSGETSATEEEVLDTEEGDEDDEIIGNGFLETAVHSTRLPAEASETEPEAASAPEEAETEAPGETTKRKKKKSDTEETAQDSGSGTQELEEVTRKKKAASETTADISEVSKNGETVTRSSRATKKKISETAAETETSGTENTPAETAPPAEADDGFSVTVTAG